MTWTALVDGLFGFYPAKPAEPAVAKRCMGCDKFHAETGMKLIQLDSNSGNGSANAGLFAFCPGCCAEMGIE